MQSFSYSVDLALCIDATGSMTPVIELVKDSALSFYEDLQRVMAEKDKRIDDLRVKVIVFRDVYVDDEPLRQSAYFRLPDESAPFASFVRGIAADGGGDEPESGLDALAAAIQSEWTRAGTKQRHVIVLWTDASAHPLDRDRSSKSTKHLPQTPVDFDEITDWWEAGQGTMGAAAKRLILFAPDAYPWSDIATHWSNVLHYPSRAGEGLAEVDYGSILDAIANSV